MSSIHRSSVPENPDQEKEAEIEAMEEEHDRSIVYSFDEIIDRSGTNSVKWSQANGAIPLGVADADFNAPPCIVDAVVERAKHGIYGYCEPRKELSEVVTWYYKHRHKLIVPDESVIFVPNLIVALNVCLRAYVPEGDKLLTTSPIYHPFLWFPKDLNRETLEVQLRYDHSRSKFSLDVEALESKLQERKDIKLFLLCNPHNPTGHVFTRKELVAINSLAAVHDLVVVSDEIHCDLIYSDCGKRHIPFASISEDAAQRCVTLNSPSKTYNVPALQCAYVIIGNPFLRSAFEVAMSEVVLKYDVGLFGMIALEKAYRKGEPWRLQLLDYLAKNRDMVMDFIAERFASHHIRVANKPDATYLMWIDATGLGLENTAAHFEKHGAFLNDGKIFGPAKTIEGSEEEVLEFDGFLRLNFAMPSKLLQQGLDNMLKAYKAALNEPLHENSATLTSNGAHKLAGWAVKRARGRKTRGVFSNSKSWRRRYFVLTENHLQYFSSLSEAGKQNPSPRGEITLHQSLRVQEPGNMNGKTNIVQLSCPANQLAAFVNKNRKASTSSMGGDEELGEVLTMSFNTPDQASLWANALRSAIAKC